MKRWGWIVLAVALTACGGDEDVDGGTGDTDSGGPVTGCADVGGPTCPTGTMCCSGVPYPTEGVCNPMCNAVSDRHAKEGFARVDGDAVLEHLAGLEISEWSYRVDDTHSRHVGPMAQDFHAAFGVGGDETLIAQVDADGVLMASVQALHRRFETLERENAELREQNRELATRVRELEDR